MKQWEVTVTDFVTMLNENAKMISENLQNLNKDSLLKYDYMILSLLMLSVRVLNQESSLMAMAYSTKFLNQMRRFIC
jgi:hypothetical protein